MYGAIIDKVNVVVSSIKRDVINSSKFTDQRVSSPFGHFLVKALLVFIKEIHLIVHIAEVY